MPEKDAGGTCKEARNRQIVGFSLPPELAVEVKTEAARRNISLRDLFGELWTLYKEKAKKAT